MSKLWQRCATLFLIMSLLFVQFPISIATAASQGDTLVDIAVKEDWNSDSLKYCRWFYGWDNRQAWCAIFVSWCANQAGISTQTIPKAAACSTMYSAILANGGSIVSTPQTGDLVFYFDNVNKYYAHVGIMKNSVQSIQGNIGGKVRSVEKVEYYNLSNGTKNYTIKYLRPNYNGNNVSNIGHTDHVKGEYLWPETLHPHYRYFKCSVCGQNFTDGTTETLSSCTQCNSQTATPVPVQPVNNLQISVLGDSKLTANSARVDASYSYTSTRPTEVGVYLGTSESSMQKTKKDTNIARNKNPLGVWYNLTGLQSGTQYYYKFYAVVNGAETTSETKTFWTPVTVDLSNNPPAEPDNLTISSISSSNVEESSASVKASYNYTGTRPSKIGVYLGRSQGSMSSVKSEEPKDKKSFSIKYKLSDLSPGTLYYYKFYAVVNGKEITSDINTFWTPVKADLTPEPTEIQKPIQTDTNNTSRLSLPVSAVSNLSQSTARVNASCSYLGTRPSEVGLYLGTSSGSMNWYKKDYINHNKNPFDIWYNLSGLNAGQTYYYQFYAIVNGNTITSNVNSFTTDSAPASAPSANTRIGVVVNTNGQYLAINDGPAASPAKSNQIGRIPPGGYVTVYPDRTSGNWYWVEYNGVSGYVYKKFLSVQ